MQAKKRFSEQAITKLREEIKDAGGNEVFALGYIDETGLVSRLDIAARGNEGAVLALRDKSVSADILIHNHPSGPLTPSDNDMYIASEAAQDGAGSFIVNNEVTEVYVVAECVKRKPRTELDGDKICAALEEGGAIAERLSVYEKRESQLGLMRLAVRAFNEDAVAAAEAGTGVGKSFAYLLPAMSFAEANDERLVISTATITLQQQLYEKDIPLVASALNSKLKTVLVKGRGNYLCRRRMEDNLKDRSLFDDEENENLDAIFNWAKTTKTGSRSDLSFLPPEGLWSKVCSESDVCLGLRCPEREFCFFLALRREASDARLLVVNHHLLFADLAARRGGAGYENTVVLPPYNRVIIDEAHTIEDAATSFFSEQFTRLGIYQQLGRLYRKRRAKKSGLLVRAAAFISGYAEKDDERISDLVNEIIDSADELDEAALLLCGAEGVFRLVRSKDEAIRAALASCLISLKKKINALGSLVQGLLERIPQANEEEGKEGTVWEIKAIMRRLDNAGAVAASFLEYAANEDKVCWIEKRQASRQNPWACFTVSPLEVSGDLKEALFEPNKTVVCVSATLTIGGGSFEYWKNRSGLADIGGRLFLTGIFPSPFPYETAVLLGVPSDAPLPAEGGFSAFVDEAAAALAEIAGGSALILFTSYQALRSAYETAKPRLENQGIRVLRQGDDDRSRLLKTFVEDQSSVLFATDSFWEGVDAPGDTLRLVILCRLPFRTPSDPVFEARCERMEAMGGNAFMELSLPEAVTKFKQGFGRLMRRSSDSGVVVVLDGRLLKKQYGRIFLQSLPETRTGFGDFKSLLRKVEEFLN
ncbi:MAG: ATP-dependent DNA helicase DinG [Treponema sp.]|nr:ATP-dependent DNA helicase DinG [Treponema sp.]